MCFFWVKQSEVLKEEEPKAKASHIIITCSKSIVILFNDAQVFMLQLISNIVLFVLSYFIHA